MSGSKLSVVFDKSLQIPSGILAVEIIGLGPRGYEASKSLLILDSIVGCRVDADVLFLAKSLITLLALHTQLNFASIKENESVEAEEALVDEVIKVKNLKIGEEGPTSRICFPFGALP